MPSAAACSWEWIEVATHDTRKPVRTRSPRSSMKSAEVVPVPSPSRIPSSTSSTAAWAAARFSAS